MPGDSADGSPNPDLMHVGLRVYQAFRAGRDTKDISALVGIPECLAYAALNRMQDLKYWGKA